MKTALITGASSGLGLEFARRLSRDGFAVALGGRRKDALEAAANEIASTGGAALACPGNITSPEDLSRSAAAVKERFGGIDFLILNAGVAHISLLADYDDFSKMKEDIETDLWGTILSARIFLPLMRPNSRILFVASAFGLVGGAGYSTYCAAKAGMINFAQSLRRELLCKGIAVHVACPADIATPMYYGELRDLPAWMGKFPGKRRPLPADKTADRILAKCRGGNFIITSDFTTFLLRLAARVLPESVMLRVVDRALPLPGK
ncbi:MAG: SDR family oxidoreductase [Elusimicrobiales bacterium]